MSTGRQKRKDLIPSPNTITFNGFHRGIKALLLVPLLLTATGATVISISDSFAAVDPASFLALGKLNPSLFGQTFIGGSDNINVLIETKTNDYSSVATQIESLGGRVTYQYQYVTGIAAQVPASGLFTLAQNPAVVSIDPDATVAINNKLSTAAGSGNLDRLAQAIIPLKEQFTLLDRNFEAAGSVGPETYINVVTHGAAPLIAQGINGRATIAAIIDTGIYSGHFMIGSAKIVGGIDISADVGTGFEGFNDIRNHWHGTAVAGVMGGFARIQVSASSLLAKSIELNAGITLPAGTVEGTKIITLSGIAPATRFFIVKVFPHDGSGASTSTVVRAMDIAIAAKQGGLDIDLMSMSLGGATLFDGRGIDGQAVDRAVQAGIAVSIAAGNEGPAPMTVADPGASNAAITSAALAHPINTRVAWDLTFGQLGIGQSLFVGSSPQIISFSSRGPTADGRAKPDVASIGVFTLSAFPLVTNRGQGLAFVSGTSFSTPATSGVISLLNDFIERNVGVDAATPTDYKKAVVNSASPIPGYTVEEQGAGFVNAQAALSALKSSPLGSTPSPLKSIATGTPLERLADIRNLFVRDRPDKAVRSFTTDVVLNPGQNVKFVFETIAGTDSIRVRFTNVNVGVNPNPTAQAAFPNSFEVYIHDAKRGGSGGGFGYYVDSLNVRGDAEFLVREASTTFTGNVFGLIDPTQLVSSTIEPGFSKVIIEGDWTNAVQVRATVTIDVTFSAPPAPDISLSGDVGQFNFATGAGLVVLGPFNLARGTVVKLSWLSGDYAHFPSSDVDLIIAKGATIDTGDNFQGATLNSPERAVVGDSGLLFILVLGFEINPPGATEHFTVAADLP